MKSKLLIVLLCVAVHSHAQRILGYEDFMKNVREKNIEYIVEKYNVSIAQAKMKAARIMPDPELSVSYENSQDRALKMGQSYSAGLDYTLELGGKRRARMAVAKTEQQVTEALVEDFFRNLRADATCCYLAALKQKQFLSLARSSYESIRELARGDSLRYAIGEIAEVDALQSRLESKTMMNAYLQMEAEYRNVLAGLTVFEGGGPAVDSLAGALSLPLREYDLPELIELAQDNRADLRAALLSRELSAANVRLAKANRMIDLGLNAGFAHNTVALNEEAPSPRHNAWSGGISIPLKFSGMNRGELQAARYAERQAEAQYEAVQLRIRQEVEQCYHTYKASCRQAELYRESTLGDAAAIFRKKKYSYTRGETTLLEVLNAQRTCNEVYRDYYQTLYDASASLVELCRAAGIWDIKL